MQERIRRVYVPMTETGFYILFCLQEEMHGYNIGQRVKAMTGGEVSISPGTMYGTLSKMEKDGLIRFIREEEKRKLYRILVGDQLGGTYAEKTHRRAVPYFIKKSAGSLMYGICLPGRRKQRGLMGYFPEIIVFDLSADHTGRLTR